MLLVIVRERKVRMETHLILELLPR